MNSSEHYKVYTIVVTYNGERWMQPCLGSLAKSTYPTKVIVVDNASHDGTVSFIRGHFPEVTLVEKKTNSGFGDANNVGIRVALEENADFIFLLNQDAWVETDTIENLVRAALKHPEYGVISPLHFNGAGTALDTAFRNYIHAGGYSSVALRKADYSVYPVAFINAAAWFIRKSCLETVGGFAPLFIHYGEDRDFIQRAKFHHSNVGWTASTRIFHDREGRSFDFSVNSKLIWYYYTGCLVRLSDVNHSLTKLIFKIALWCLGDCLKFLTRGRWYSLIAFTKVFAQIKATMPEIRRYRTLLESRKKFLFLD